MENEIAAHLFWVLAMTDERIEGEWCAKIKDKPRGSKTL